VLPERARGPAVRIAGGLLAIATVVFVVLDVARRWDDLAEVVRDADVVWLVVSFLAFTAAEVVYAFSWPATLRRMGHDVRFVPGAAAFLVAQTTKFVPGGVWLPLGRVGTADRLQVPKREATAGWTLETSITVAATVLIIGVTGAASHLLFDDVGPALRALEVVGAVVGATAAVVVGRKAANKVAQRALLERADVAVLLVWHLAVWLGYASATGFVTVALGGPFWPTIGAFTIGWLAGFVIVGAPAGLGVREAVTTAALTPSAGATTALAVAVGSRAIWTVVSIALAGVAVPTLRATTRVADPEAGDAG
jgi:uncharacterized membrane protein YbhN (UPF0104 family)